MNWRCGKDADLNIAGQSIDNLSLHVIHIGFIGDLFNSKRLVVHVERGEPRYCQRAVFVSDLAVMQMNVFSPHRWNGRVR